MYSNHKVKVTHNSWWIGGIVGIVLGLIIVKEGTLTGIIVGAFNGIFFGWLIGLIVDGTKKNQIFRKIQLKCKILINL